MSILTPNTTVGDEYIDGTRDITAFTSDDGADPFVNGSYVHDPRLYSATAHYAVFSTLASLIANQANGTFVNITVNDVINALGRLRMSAITAPGDAQAGDVWYDTDRLALTMQTHIAGTSLQVGNEMLTLARNVTGATIPNGAVVYVSGASGNTPTIALADADIDATADSVIGVCTVDGGIADNAFGYICVYGEVRGIDTSGYAVGDTLYLSQTAGQLTNTKPAAPSNAVRVGTALDSTNNGTILVEIARAQRVDSLSDTVIAAPADRQGLSYDSASGTWINTETLQPIGGLVAPGNLTISYSAATRQFTTTVGAGVAVYANGVRSVPVSETTAAHADTGGPWFAYYAAGSTTLTVSSTPWDILTHAPVALILYDPAGPSAKQFEERHTIRFDPLHHYTEHYYEGTKHLLGGEISGITITPSSPTNADNLLVVSSGVIADEDIVGTIPQLDAAGPYSVWRLTGTEAASYLVWDDTPTVPLRNAAAGYIYYNQLTGGSWQETALTNGDFVNYWVFRVILHSGESTIILMGQAVYSTLSDAQAADLGSEMTIAGIQEYAPQYKITYRASSSYTTDGKVRVEAVEDLRGKKGGAAGAVVAGVAHNSLTDRDAADAHPATALSYDNTTSLLSATTVQAAIDELKTLIP